MEKFKDANMGKYNNKLFVMGFFINVIRKFPLILIAAICGIVGIWITPCLYISIGIIALILVWLLVQQFMIKHTVEHSDNPNFTPYADAMMSDDWKGKIIDIVNEKIDKE